MTTPTTPTVPPAASSLPPAPSPAAIAALAARHALDPGFPDDVLAEAEAWLAAPGLDDPALRDLEPLPFVTIDNPDSRDLDQALHIAPAPDGGYVIHYALADAAYYVRPGARLWDEALRRGASYYLPGFTVPMLPRALSEGLVSLNEAQPRRALVVVLTLSPDGACVGAELLRARIRSRAKLTYGGVQAFYDAGDAGALAGQPFTETLQLLRTVGLLRIAEAERRDVVVYHRGDRYMTERYNEQISLMCNAEGGRLLARHPAAHVQPIFRVHPSPPEPRLVRFAAMTRAIAQRAGAHADAWRWRRRSGHGQPGESLSDYLRRLPVDGDDDEARRLAMALHRQALVLNQASSLSAEPGPHFGVGAEPYARLSSPMREIIGVYTHKEAVELLEGVSPSADAIARDEVLREAVIEAGERARRLQSTLTKEAAKLGLDALFGADLALPAAERPRRVGTVVGLRRDRIYVQLDAPDHELKVYAGDLEAAFGAALTPTRHEDALTDPDGAPVLRLGDALGLRVDRYDVGANRWRFELAR